MENKYKLGEKDTRPWGNWEIIEVNNNSVRKIIKVNGGEILSLQRHKYRAEYWVIVEGKGRITIDDKIFETVLNQEYYIPKTAWHRIENIGKKPLVFIETQTGDILDEKDIERKEDKYSRV